MNYTPIEPTYLYIKQHSITSLKYFGKTSQNPHTYMGSGKYWKSHIKKHGQRHVQTLWVSEPFTDTSINDVAVTFSIENNIVESNEWANLEIETGLDGRPCGPVHSDEWKRELSIRMRNDNPAKTDEARMKISQAKTGKSRSKQVCDKISAARVGTYHFLDPDGNPITIIDMKRFCRDNGLTACYMFQVAKGKRAHYKNYRIVPLQ